MKHIALILLAFFIAACQHKPLPHRSQCAIGSCNTSATGACSCANKAAGYCRCLDGDSLNPLPGYPD